MPISTVPRPSDPWGMAMTAIAIGQQQRAEGEQRRIAADAVAEPAEGGRREQRREEDVAVDRAGGRELEPVRVLEILDRERAAEREDHRVPEHAEHEQVPVGAAEAGDVAEREALRAAVAALRGPFR